MLKPIPPHELFAVNVDVIDGKLVCRVRPQGEYSDLRFSFQLRRDGHVIADPVFLPTREMSWELEGSGVYWVNVWSSIPGSLPVSSRYIQYFAPPVVAAYSKWLAEDGCDSIPDLPLRRAVAPFRDLAAVLLREVDLNGVGLEACAREAGLVPHRLRTALAGGMYLLTTGELATDEVGQKWAFSGLARYGDDLVVGQEQAQKCLRDSAELRDAVGDFTVVRWDGQQVVFEADYFGLGRIYYIDEPQAVIASNNYHLLLEIAQSIGLDMRLDIEKAIAGFFDAGPFFQANFSHRMDVANSRQVRVDHRFALSLLGASVEPTGLHADLNRNEEFDERVYERLLFAARAEIASNAEAAFRNSEFDHIRVDLTGGTDSRLVYGAVTVLPQSMTRNSRVFYEYAGNSEAGEPAIVEFINGLYRFKWDAGPYEMGAQEVESDVLRQSPHSAYMGNYFAHGDYENWLIAPRTLVLSGGMGEACAKAEMRYWFPEGDDAAEVINEFCHSRGDSLVSFASADYFSRVIMESIGEMPGRSDVEKVDNLYVFFRSGIHYSTKGRSSTASWAPLMSRSSFRAKCMRFSREVDRKVGFDLLNVMNSLLAAAPLSDGQKTRQREDLKSELYNGGILGAGISAPSAAEEVRVAAENRARAMTYCPDPEIYRQRLDDQRRQFGDDHIPLLALREIIASTPEMYEVGLALYYFITSGKAGGVRYARESVRNRILSIYYQLRLCAP